MEVYANTQRKLTILPEVLRENVGAIILEFIRKNTGIQLDDPQDPAYREDEPVTEDDDAESWQKLFESVSEETRQWMTDLIDGESGDCSALGMQLDAMQSFLDLVRDFQKKDYCADLLEIPQTKTVMVTSKIVDTKGKKGKQVAEEQQTTPYERDAAAIKQTAAWMRVGMQMLMAAKEQNLLNTWEQEINEIKNDPFISYKSEYLTSWFRSVVDVLYAFFDQMKAEDAARYDDLCLGLLAEHDQIMSLVQTWLETHREAMSSHREVQTVRKALAEARDSMLVLQSRASDGNREELTQRLLEESDAKILELGRELDRITQERDDLVKRVQSFDIDSTKAQRMVADLERRNDELEQHCTKLLAKAPPQTPTKTEDNNPLLNAFQVLASNFGIVCQFQDGADPMIEVSRVISSLSDF